MEPIQEIGVPFITIPQVKQSDWIYGIPFIPNNNPPVTLQIGFPIVDMPGCVDMHKDNKDHVSNLPFDKDLVNQDPKGSTVLCPHGEYPSYNAMDYTPENLIITREIPPPPVEPPPDVEPPEAPDKIEQNATTPTAAINKALMEFENGSNGSTESQELLQLSSD